ncbi:MAG TPA: threonine/serine exporter family protein, partial [Microthrixaceae bacterium]|nr:threonine/serine exporter family protein [Microthrixaceae bacterium]
MTELEQHELHTLQMFVVELGAALNETGEPVYEVQERLTRAAHSYGAHDARISAFPTYMMVTMGRGEPATVELTGQLASTPRL